MFIFILLTRQHLKEGKNSKIYVTYMTIEMGDKNPSWMIWRRRWMDEIFFEWFGGEDGLMVFLLEGFGREDGWVGFSCNWWVVF